MMTTLEQFLQAAGRLHPILVHFPIAMVLAAAAFETARAALRRPTPARTSINMLAIGVSTAAAAIASGWLNADFERSRSDTTLELHRWIAIGGGCAALTALLLGITAGPRRTGLTAAFRATLVVSAGAIGFAGHLGGSMVYGEGYLLAPFKKASTPATNPPPLNPAAGNPVARPEERGSVEPIMAKNVSFDRDVLPILESRCVECHGAGRTRAGLRLDSLDHARSADEWVIAPGDPDASDLVTRITLPETEDGTMPPDGPRLTDGEINTIRVWIASLSGVPADVADLVEPGLPADPSNSAQEVSGQAQQEQPGEPSPAEIAAIKAIRDLGAHVGPIASDSDSIELNASLAGKSFTDDSLTRILPIAPRVERLDLSGTAVTDASLPSLIRFTRLERLNLSRTAVTRAGAPSIAAIRCLRVLNIGRTAVDDPALADIVQCESLERIYAWGSLITTEAAERAMAANQGLAIDLGVADLSPEPVATPDPAKPGG
jgi:uncharacterized membrane protein